MKRNTLRVASELTEPGSMACLPRFGVLEYVESVKVTVGSFQVKTSI